MDDRQYEDSLDRRLANSDTRAIGAIAMDLSTKLTAAYASLDAHRVAMDQMRDELAEARSHAERGWQRVKVLEAKIENARKALEGTL